MRMIRRQGERNECPGTVLAGDKQQAPQCIAPKDELGEEEPEGNQPHLLPETIRQVIDPVRPSSPSRISASPSRGAAISQRMRASGTVSNLVVASALPGTQPGCTPSIISFAAEVRRAKKGENWIEEVHMLRLLHNHNLQWQCVNARAEAALTVQRLAAEVEGTGTLVSQLAKEAGLDQSRDLLSTIAALHVKRCSLRGHFLQLYNLNADQASCKCKRRLCLQR